MATTTVSPAELSVKTENVEYVRFSNPTNTKDVRVISSPSEAVQKDMESKGYIRQASQTITIPRAGTVDGMQQIISDSEELVNIFNRGLMQKLTQKVNANLGDSDDNGNPTFSFTEEAYDPSGWLNEATSRRNLTPEEKAVRDLQKSGLSAAVIESMLAVMRGQQ